MPKKKEINCKWIIACGSSSIDIDTNSLSLSNIIEEITLTLAPGQTVSEKQEELQPIPLPLDVVILFERENDVEGIIELPISVHFVDPKGAILAVMSNEIKMGKQHKRFRVRFKLNAVPFTGLGEYKFHVISGDTQKTVEKNLCDSSLVVKLNS